MPDIADRHTDAQSAAPRLGAGGIEHAGSQHAEFELTNAALHAEQQPIVGATWIVYAVQINHARLDQSAQFDQMMPVVPVTRAGRRRNTRPLLPRLRTATLTAARSPAWPSFRWRSGQGHHRSPRHAGTHGAALHRRVHIAVAGLRGWFGLAPEWTAEHRLPLCASAPPPEGDQRSSSSRSSVTTPAACIKRFARHAITFVRSDAFMPCNRIESNMMQS